MEKQGLARWFINYIVSLFLALGIFLESDRLLLNQFVLVFTYDY